MLLKTVKVGKAVVVVGLAGVGMVAGASVSVAAQYTSLGAAGKALFLLGGAPVKIVSAPVVGAALAGLAVTGATAWAVTCLATTVATARETAIREGFQDGPGGATRRLSR